MNRAYAAIGATVGLFLLVQLGALALVQPFMDAGYQTVEDPTDPTNSLLYVGAIIVATALMLVSMRFGVDRLLQGFVVFAAVLITYYVFSVVLPPAVEVRGVNAVAVVAALAIGAGLLVYPEWYVIDAAGVVMGAGAAALFGISFGLLPALVLLVVLAVYDAISVYGTEHMLTLASGAMDLRLPVVFVVPLTMSYSFLEEDADAMADESNEAGGTDGESPEVDGTADEGETEQGASTGPVDGSPAADADGGLDGGDPHEEGAEVEDPFARDAFFVGLGDAVIPAILVASAAFFRPGETALLDVTGLALTVPALGAMVGTLVGLVALLGMVMKGRAHAGLPLLNGGAIAGYLLGAVMTGVALLEAIGVAPYL